MRDYCQHGEPMDEHCPQCNTKAAANDSATAPVPAGGTPEGLAREKVEMTDSEVKPSSPTTEAGRDLIARMMILFRAQHESVEAFTADILAIEREAWDKGRREAVRDLNRIRGAIMEGTDSDTGDVWLHRQDADILRGLVAGLEGEGRSPIGSNASESPDPEYDRQLVELAGRRAAERHASESGDER